MRSARASSARHHGGGILMKTKLGVNIGQNIDYSDQQMTFVNMVRNARGFGPLSDYTTYGNNTTLDSNGWPTTDFGIVVFAGAADPLGRNVASYNPGMVGTYKLSFNGQATLASLECTISNKVYTAGTNTTTADVTFSGTGVSISLEFSGTSGGCQNIILNRPGYPIASTQVFTTAFLNSLAPFSCMRFMDFLATNDSTATTWAARTQPTNPIQGMINQAANNSGKGVAWEYVIQLANATGKDIWINIGYHVDVYDATANNYITQLATLIKATLNPGIHVYVEYSNELWNFGFPQHYDIIDAATAAEAGGDPEHLNYDGVNISDYWALRLQAHRTLLISNLFKAVYGATLFASTVRIVLMTQGANPGDIEDMMVYLATNYGAPNTYLYGIGGDGYVQVDYGLVWADMNALFASLNSHGGVNSLGYVQKMPYFAETPAYTGGNFVAVPGTKPIADFYGVKSLCYEGGLDLDPSHHGSDPISANSQADARTGTVITNTINTWFANHNDLFMYYQLAAPVGSYWGLYEDVGVPTVKSAALIALAATVLPT